MPPALARISLFSKSPNPGDSAGSEISRTLRHAEIADTQKAASSQTFFVQSLVWLFLSQDWPGFEFLADLA